MISKNIVQDLKNLGLTEYEAKVYLALAQKGPLTACAISEKSDVPQSKVYEVLGGLKNRALVSFWGNKPQLFKAVEPNFALRKMLELKQRSIAILEKKTQNLLRMLKSSKKDTSSFWMSKGKREFLAKATEMIGRAESSGYATTSRFSRYPELDRAMMEAVKRGVKVKILGTDAFDLHNRARAEWYLNSGAEIRLQPMNIHPIIGVADDKEICLRIDHSEDSDFIWSNNPVLVTILKGYFETLWERGQECRTVNLQY